MRAEITKNGQVTIVQLEGQISFETIDLFREHCLSKLKGEKVIFNLQKLNFVGSIGITSFFEVIKDIKEKNILDPKFCCVKTEFLRLFEAWFAGHIEVYDLEDNALKAFLDPELCLKNTPSQPIRIPSFKLDEGFVEDHYYLGSDVKAEDGID